MWKSVIWRTTAILVAWLGVLFALPAPLFGDSYTSTQVIVRFAPAVVTPPPGKTGGDVSEFSFSGTGMQFLLGDLGVTSMNRVFPEFDHSDVHAISIDGDSI